MSLQAGSATSQAAVGEVFAQLHLIGLELERIHPNLYISVSRQVSPFYLTYMLRNFLNQWGKIFQPRDGKISNPGMENFPSQEKKLKIKANYITHHSGCCNDHKWKICQYRSQFHRKELAQDWCHLGKNCLTLLCCWRSSHRLCSARSPGIFVWNCRDYGLCHWTGCSHMDCPTRRMGKNKMQCT